MRIDGDLVEARFLARENRFRVTVETREGPVGAHLPNSGRLDELLVPGYPVLLVRRTAPNRKTGFDMALVQLAGHWVSVDARLPNDLAEEAILAGRLAPFVGYKGVSREVVFGESRLDFLLEAPGRLPCLIEVKSVTLVVDGLACFPDAVTSRGRRHLRELAAALQLGYRAAALFVVQRGDARGMRPHDESDPEFGRALREVAARGVEIYAFACSVQPPRIEISHPLPLHAI